MKFKHYLFLPTIIVLVYWLFSLPILIFPQFAFFSSDLYSNKFATVVLTLATVFVVWKWVLLIVKKEYKNSIAVLLGFPLALVIGFVLTVLLFGVSGV